MTRSEAPPQPQPLLGGGSSSGDLPTMRRSFSSLDKRTLLRASPARLVLRGFGRIFASSEGSEATYELSEPVEQIDIFLSHNWSTPRFIKFAVLALHYNFVPALVMTSAVMCVLFLLTALGELPIVQCRPLRGEPWKQTGICASLFGPIIFLGLLFTWHEVVGRLGFMRERVFLDKTCIHQVDPEKKKKGILSLAAFLERTDKMLVVYTSDYVRRLWTAFELASLLILYPEKKLQVMPIFFLRPIVLGQLAIHLGLIFLSVLRIRFSTLDIKPKPIDLSYLGAFIGALFLVFVTRVSQQLKEDLLATARGFSLSKAACAVEEDRELVIRSVQEFLRLKGRVPPGASREQALQTFDEMVHQEIPKKVLQDHGATGIPYMYMVVVFLPWAFHAVDWAGAMVYSGEEPSVVLFFVALMLTMIVFVMPLVSALSMLLMEQALHVPGWRGIAARLCVDATTFALTISAAMGNIILVATFEHFPRMATFVLLAFVATVAFLTWCVHYKIVTRRVEHAVGGGRELEVDNPKDLEEQERVGLTAKLAGN